MKYILIIYSFLCFFSSCKPTNEVLDNHVAAFPLRFDADTVLFDTLIATNKVSVTKRLMVYNTSANAIRINSIFIGNKFSSPFSIYINGQKGVAFDNVEILGTDSLLILVNVTVAPNNVDHVYIITDSLNFVVNNFSKHVVLNTWGQDAFFHVNDTIASNITLSNAKPHVIYGNYVVSHTGELHIPQATKLMFYNNASLIVNGKLDVLGTKAQKVIFCSFRQDKEYADLPGQWKGIVFNSMNISHVFSWVSISNAEHGLFFNKTCNANFVLSNAIIANVSKSCISTYNAAVTLSNSVLYRSMNGLLNVYGGDFKAYNNTITNYSSGFSNSSPCVMVDDSYSMLKVSMINNIVWGSASKEFSIELSNSLSTDITIKNNILKLADLPLYPANILIADNAKFKLKNTSILNFMPDTISQNPLVLSPAFNKGEVLPLFTDVDDFNGNSRDSSPDIGAVEIVD
jgi:hypothetical protein